MGGGFQLAPAALRTISVSELLAHSNTRLTGMDNEEPRLFDHSLSGRHWEHGVTQESGFREGNDLAGRYHRQDSRFPRVDILGYQTMDCAVPHRYLRQPAPPTWSVLPGIDQPTTVAISPHSSCCSNS